MRPLLSTLAAGAALAAALLSPAAAAADQPAPEPPNRALASLLELTDGAPLALVSYGTVQVDVPTSARAGAPTIPGSCDWASSINATSTGVFFRTHFITLTQAVECSKWGTLVGGEPIWWSTLGTLDTLYDWGGMSGGRTVTVEPSPVRAESGHAQHFVGFHVCFEGDPLTIVLVNKLTYFKPVVTVEGPHIGRDLDAECF